MVALGLQFTGCAESNQTPNETSANKDYNTEVNYANGVTKLRETDNFIFYRHRNITPEWTVDKKLHQKIDRLDSLMDAFSKRLDEEKKSAVRTYESYGNY